MPTTESSHASNEAELRRLIADQMSAISARDVDRIMSFYAAEVVVFDVKPPFQTVGSKAWRRTWEECLPYLPASFRTETRDLRLTVNGDLALAHWIWRFTDLPKNHPAAQTWMRNTAGYRKIRDRWQIVHEHGSVPFDPETLLAEFTLEPETNK